jgi:hypothetical protein
MLFWHKENCEKQSGRDVVGVRIEIIYSKDAEGSHLYNNTHLNTNLGTLFMSKLSKWSGLLIELISQQLVYAQMPEQQGSSDSRGGGVVGPEGIMDAKDSRSRQRTNSLMQGTMSYSSIATSS